MGKPATRSAVVPRSATARSRITNGKSLFAADIDLRSSEARRFRDVLAQIVADLGNADRLSEGQRQLARRAAMLSVQCEVMEGLSVAGKPIDLELYGSLCDRLGRTFARLGLKRVPRDVTPPTIDEYLRHRAEIEANAEDAA